MSEEMKNLTENTPEIKVVETNVEADKVAEEKVAPKAKSGKQKSEKPKKQKGGLKAFLKSRKAKHGAVSVAIIAVVVAITIVINVICGLLTERFPETKIDFTKNNSFALQDDTVDYMAHLNKDVTLNILMPKNDFKNYNSYFMQAHNLLEKMVSSSNGKIKIEYVDLTENPTFTANYPDIDWNNTQNSYVMIAQCGEQYKVLTIEDCFEYDQEYLAYAGQYSFTNTKIEQAVVTAILNVTTEDKVVVNLIKGNGEQDYTGVKSLLENNAYDVKEVSLATEGLNENAEVVILFAPSVDLDESATDTLSAWLDNDGKYGRTLVYIPCAEKVDTPNLDKLVSDWGMEVNGGYVFETDSQFRISQTNSFAFIVNYTEYYTDMLKNSSIPVLTNNTHNIIIKDENMAHGILQTSDNVGVMPYDADEKWDYQDALTGEALNVAAEGVKENNDKKSSRVVVFGSFMMFDASVLAYNSNNNAAYFMNVINSAVGNDDVGITIESKSLQSEELGVTDIATGNVILIIFVFVIPIGILLTGLVMWLRRRNR